MTNECDLPPSTPALYTELCGNYCITGFSSIAQCLLHDCKCGGGGKGGGCCHWVVATELKDKLLSLFVRLNLSSGVGWGI